MTLGPFLKTEDLYRIVEKDVLVNLMKICVVIQFCEERLAKLFIAVGH